VPLIGWLTLHGRCRNCRAWIGWRYPLVELGVSLLWICATWRVFASLAYAIDYPEGTIQGDCWNLQAAIPLMLLYWLLAALAILDAENLWLPDYLTVPGILIGFAVCLENRIFSHRFDAGFRPFHCLLAKALSVLAAAGLILLIRWLYWLIRRREGIGLGDAKLMAMLAAWLGFPGALLAFVLGVILGALVAVVQLAVPSVRNPSQPRSAGKLPLGTFLCIGGIVSSLWGRQIIAAYLRWADL
jgi:leader peptidase (prepilin peptidase)/N-methyltransferase